MAIDNKIMKKSILESYKDKTFRENDKNIEKYETIIKNSTKYGFATLSGLVGVGFGLFFYDFAKAAHPIMDSIGAGVITASPLVTILTSKIITNKAQEKITKANIEMYKIIKENYIKNHFIDNLIQNGSTHKSAENQYQNLNNANLAVLNDNFEYAMSLYILSTKKGFDYRTFISENERTQARITEEKKAKRELIINRVYGGFDISNVDDNRNEHETEDTINLTEEMENLDLQVESENIDLQMEGELC